MTTPEKKSWPWRGLWLNSVALLAALAIGACGGGGGDALGVGDDSIVVSISIIKRFATKSCLLLMLMLQFGHFLFF